jgi:hypothetical protein
MSSRFDELAKALARGLTRRDALRLLGGTFTVAALAPLGARQAWGDVPGGGLSCGEGCQDAGFEQGSAQYTACVHACHQAVESCEENALQGCVTLIGATVTITCCDPSLPCTASACVCPMGDIICPNPTVTSVQSCCPTGVLVCNVAAGVCTI